jgi:hypothetical protein
LFHSFYKKEEQEDKDEKRKKNHKRPEGHEKNQERGLLTTTSRGEFKRRN